MANIDQMTEDMKTITAIDGKVYKFRRPWIRFWKLFNEFVDMAKTVEPMAMQTGKVSEEFLDKYTDFLFAWLSRSHPDITKEEIEENFDLSHIPELMLICTEYYAQVYAISPPDPAGIRRRRLGRDMLSDLRAVPRLRCREIPDDGHNPFHRSDKVHEQAARSLG